MKIYRASEVIKILSIGKSTLWRWVETGAFPKPLKLGDRVTGWSQETIQNWIDNRETKA